ncbi:ORF6N domain-containing protein [Desulfonatronovibrio hydrogenovorans]|uniref:ORF6N domain-containing protein n=1 Tax=Desulfonatronovibrio hydrogenovorans TaxID=53245 RepID=UPI00338ED64B
MRGTKVILDSDLAELYGVEIKRINEAVTNNPEKFPKGYLFELTREEWTPLKSKFSTSNRGGKVKLPTAFTEKGLYMLATILKSAQTVQTTIAINAIMSVAAFNFRKLVQKWNHFYFSLFLVSQIIHIQPYKQSQTALTGQNLNFSGSTT